MSKEEKFITIIEQVIRELVPRLAQTVAGIAKYPEWRASDFGCCSDRGCCGDKGCCKDKGRLDMILAGCPECMEGYIITHKEEVINFFKEKGVDLKL